MSEAPRALIAQARKVFADCERYLDKVGNLVDVLPSDIDQAEWDIYEWKRDRYPSTPALGRRTRKNVL